MARWPGGVGGLAGGAASKVIPADTVTHPCDGDWPALSVTEYLNKTRSPGKTRALGVTKTPKAQ